MLTELTQSWWLWMLRGVLAVIFGLFAILQPSIALATLILLFAIYALGDGALAVSVALRVRGQFERWWLLLMDGIISVAAGVLALFRPDITALLFLCLIAVWTFLSGVMVVVAGVRLPNNVEGKWSLILSGSFSFSLGVLLVLVPDVGFMAWVGIVGAYALLFGIVLIELGWRLRLVGQRFHSLGI